VRDSIPYLIQEKNLRRSFRGRKLKNQIEIAIFST